MDMKSALLFPLLTILATGILIAQDPAPTPQPTPQVTPTPPASPIVTTLQGLIQAMSDLRAEQAQVRTEIEALKKSGAEASEVKTASEKLARLAQDWTALRGKFEQLATGTSEEAFEAGGDADVQLSDELKILLQPLLTELHKSTERPREIERLRADVTFFKRRQDLAQNSLARLDELLPQIEDELLKADLEKLQSVWNTRQGRVKSELETAQFQLEGALENQEPLSNLIGRFISDFLANRGKTLGLAVLGGIVTIFLLALAIRGVERFVPDKDDIRRSLPFRLVRLLLFLLATFLGIFAFLGILYARSDWLLLGLSLIFILGFFWAARNALLSFYEQLKTVLNLGPVREGERVIFDGIPWEVKTINFYTDLVNPLLSGGHVRVALSDLTELHSRPKARKEPLFPCEAGEWVQLSDGTYGEVLSQTPELVRLRTIPGSLVSYQTATFLGLAPDNHSGAFGLRVPIGIDYQHQEISTTEARQKLETFIKSGLEEYIGAENIKGLWVEFSGAGASSLDYTVGISLDGAVAGRKPALTRAVQRLFVDACNKYQWVIPFTQVTVHQAA